MGIHWHVKTNYAEYWRSKVTVTNRQLYTNYTDWNLVVEVRGVGRRRVAVILEGTFVCARHLVHTDRLL